MKCGMSRRITTQPRPFLRAEWSLVTLGPNWAALKVGFGAVFFADPWAGVFCLYNQYAAALKFQLDKWQRQGKRVHVDWANTSGWMNANNSAILSLTGEGRTIHNRGADAVPVGVL